MKKLTQKQKDILLDMVGNNDSIVAIQLKAKEFGVQVPNDIYSVMKKHYNAINKHIIEGTKPTMKENRKRRIELFGRNYNSGKVSELIEWIMNQ